MTKKYETLSQLLNELNEQGYKEQFNLKNNALLAKSANQSYSPEHIELESTYRFEGVSNPADMSIVYQIKTNDNVKGTLVDAFGTYANPEIEKFMQKCED